jgi:hypothetical protein
VQSRSKNNVLIRLTDVGWQHIVEGHPELINNKKDILMAVSQPEHIFEGNTGELIAIRKSEAGKWLVVIYRELLDDGFIITAFSTRRLQYLTKRTQVWP